MISRERVLTALRHREPDRVPVDLGATRFSGITGISYNNLRKHLNLPVADTKIYDVWQQLALVEPDLLDLFGVDVVGLNRLKVSFGIKNTSWKPYLLPDGSPALVPSGFNTALDEEGENLAVNGRVIARRPRGGFYFDFVHPPMEKEFNRGIIDNYPWDLIRDDEFAYLKAEGERLFETGRAVVGNYVGSVLAFGLILRGYQQFMIDLIMNKSLVQYLFEKMTGVHLKNLERFAGALGDKIQIIQLMGDDLGTQKGTLISPRMYRELIKPWHREIFGYVRKNTNWHIMMHCCGSIRTIIPDLIEIGVDILNPVQTSAHDMDPAELKREFGRDLVFWGGGCDTQSVLPNASAQEVADHVRERIGILAPDGGFVFNPVMNIQHDVPPGNIVAAYKTALSAGVY